MPASVEVNGAEIERLRKERAGLSRRDMARAMGMSEVALYYIERGRRNGRSCTQPETLQRIAALLRVKPEELAQQPTPVSA